VSRNKDPAVLFYTSDFLSGSMCLTMEERGQYITLLCLQHQKGHLSKKDIELAVGKVSLDVMKKFVTDEEGRYFNERMDEEAQRRKRFTESRRKSSLSRFAKTPCDTSHDVSYDNHTIHRTGNENINNTLDISNTEVDSFNFSNTTTTTTTNIYLSMSEDERVQLELRICEMFAKAGAKSDPYDFIAFNKSRGFIGIGGENVLEDLPRYIERWERREMQKGGEHERERAL
jgi:uncharacterized protein YdaU (DUF1376 family)